MTNRSLAAVALRLEDADEVPCRPIPYTPFTANTLTTSARKSKGGKIKARPRTTHRLCAGLPTTHYSLLAPGWQRMWKLVLGDALIMG